MNKNNKSFAQMMYEQEERDIENAVNTLNRIAAQNQETTESSEIEEINIDQKAIVLKYLENAYSGAKMMGDVEMMCRLSRAILAFDYDGLEKHPTWDEMQEAYMAK